MLNGVLGSYCMSMIGFWGRVVPWSDSVPKTASDGVILPILPNDSNVFGRTPLLLRVTVYWSFTGGLEVDNGVRVCGKVGENC